MMHFTNFVEPLKSSWKTLLQPFRVEPELGYKVFLGLVNAYSGAERFYHNLGHIYQVLEIIEQMKSLSLNFQALQLAAWFHDVIYDPKAQDNEQKSAEYAEAALNSLQLPKDLIFRVINLIWDTKNHLASPTDIDSQILLDADLAILGSAEWKYQAYAEAIRQEYSWISDAEYRVGRKQVLHKFLQRERLYLTPYLFTKLEANARNNLRSEIIALSSLNYCAIDEMINTSNFYLYNLEFEWLITFSKPDVKRFI